MSQGLSADDNLSVAANATSNEQVASDKQTVQESGTLYILANSAAVGVTAQLEVDGKAIWDDLEIENRNSALIYPDDTVIWSKVKKGDIISLKFRNTTAAAIVVKHRLFIA